MSSLNKSNSTLIHPVTEHNIHTQADTHPNGSDFVECDMLSLCVSWLREYCLRGRSLDIMNSSSRFFSLSSSRSMRCCRMRSYSSSLETTAASQGMRYQRQNRDTNRTLLPRVYLRPPTGHEEEEEEETLFDPKSTNVQITIPHISDIQFKQLCTHIYRHYVHKHSS